jgi:hypothetical protein
MDLEHGGYFSLNPMAAIMFRELESGRSPDDIVAELGPRFLVEPFELRRDINTLIAELVEYGLLQGAI